MCVLFRRVAGSFVVLRPRFRRSHVISWKKILLVLVFLSWCFFPLPCVPDGNVFPPASAVCAGSERIPYRLYRACMFECIPSFLYSACISGTYTFPPMQRGYYSFSCNFWALLFLSGYSCARLSTVVAFSPFFWEKSVRECLVPILVLDPAV